jgi:hypothetical protein
MSQRARYVGFDAHTATLSVAERELVSAVRGGFKGSAHCLGGWQMIAATRRCHDGVSAIHGVREG